MSPSHRVMERPASLSLTNRLDFVQLRHRAGHERARVIHAAWRNWRGRGAHALLSEG